LSHFLHVTLLINKRAALGYAALRSDQQQELLLLGLAALIGHALLVLVGRSFLVSLLVLLFGLIIFMIVGRRFLRAGGVLGVSHHLLLQR